MMTFAIRMLGVLALLALTSPANAGFITYRFITDSSDFGGSLAGSFKVDESEILDGILSTNDVQNYSFAFTAGSGEITHYTLNDVLPDISVNPSTGFPSVLDGVVIGDQFGNDSAVIVSLNSTALTPNSSFWFAFTNPTEEFGGGLGHWEIGPIDANPVPAPAGVLLGIVGFVCIAIGRIRTHRLTVAT